MKLNDMHRAVLRDYADGDFAYLAEQEFITEVDQLGDTLLTFILIELSVEEDCESLEDGISRMTRARDDLDICLIALDQLQQELEVRITSA